jgi:phosphosulfolactate synthase
MGDVTRSPDFLDLPARSSKPRMVGLTHLLDKGAGVPELEALVDRAGAGIDVWKLGWGTAYLEPDVPEKVSALAARGIRACVGGTLLEVAWGQGRAEACLAWAADAGFPCIEISNGAVAMPLREKRRLISAAAERFVVLSEVGSKDPTAEVSAEGWSDEMVGDLEAGATWVLTEGRESGTVGLYEPDGSVRAAVVEAVVGGGPSPRDLRGARGPAGMVHQSVRRRVSLGNVRWPTRSGWRRCAWACARTRSGCRCGRTRRRRPRVSNLVPRRYRGVSVTDVDVPLEPGGLRAASWGARRTGGPRSSSRGRPVAPPSCAWSRRRTIRCSRRSSRSRSWRARKTRR